MSKPSQSDLYVPPSGKIPAERRAIKTGRAKPSRRRLLLSYQTWLAVTQDVARAAEKRHYQAD